MAIEHRATLSEIAHFKGQWVTAKQLAKILNVHPSTIRRWANKGLIKHTRHPMNNYRLFLKPNFIEAIKHD